MIGQPAKLDRGRAMAIDFDPQRGRWIPWVFVGGMGFVVVVNAVLVWAALSTFTGLTVGKAYDRGRTYNHVLATAERQHALGWRAVVAVEGRTLTLAVLDREGLAVSGRVEGVLRRPLEGIEESLDFAALGEGRFLAALPPLRAGQWEARLTLRGPAGDAFDIRERLLLQ